MPAWPIWTPGGHEMSAYGGRTAIVHWSVTSKAFQQVRSMRLGLSFPLEMTTSVTMSRCHHAMQCRVCVCLRW